MAKVRVYSVGDVRLELQKSQPPKLVIAATGLAITTGWTSPELKTIEKELSPDGIIDLEFVATPPSGIVLQVLTPISADLIWEEDVEKVVGVKIYARSNDLTRLLREQPDFTTLAVGEESVDTVSLARTGRLTTLVLGEESPTLLGAELPPTIFRGENPKPFIGETSPGLDDPKPPFGEIAGDPTTTWPRSGPFGVR